MGHWEDDTLVMDRATFNERVWVDQPAHPHSDQLHVIERYRRPDLGTWENRSQWKTPACRRSRGPSSRSRTWRRARRSATEIGESPAARVVGICFPSVTEYNWKYESNVYGPASGRVPALRFSTIDWSAT
jgi:hypothetical protein